MWQKIKKLFSMRPKPIYIVSVWMNDERFNYAVRAKDITRIQDGIGKGPEYTIYQPYPYHLFIKCYDGSVYMLNKKHLDQTNVVMLPLNDIDEIREVNEKEMTILGCN